MKYDVYFHNDFDGRASAAVMLSFLRSRGDDIEHYVPLGFNIIPEWLKEDFFERHKFFRGGRNPAIVLDFPYHPKATFWFDHHPTAFKKEIWRKQFRQNKFHRYDPEYKSACHLVFAALRKDFGWKPPRHLRELVKWLDVTDDANYRSPRQIIDLKEPALQVGVFADRNSDGENASKWIVELLATKQLKDVAAIPKIRKITREFHDQIKVGLAFCRKNTEVYKKAAFLDLSMKNFDRVSEGMRYAAYYLYPKIVYSARLTRKDGLFHLGLGLNPWRRSEGRIHIGELMKKYGGGGHKTVGGAEFETHARAVAAAKDIMVLLDRP